MQNTDGKREKVQKELKIGYLILYVGSAAIAASVCSDFVAGDYVSAIGNFGLLLITGRFAAKLPKAIAIALKGDEAWIRAEEEIARKRYPWADSLGKIGWGFLFFSVILQIGLDFL